MIKEKLSTKNKSKWVNKKEFIIVHHTGTGEGTIKWVLNGFTWRDEKSCHYVVDTNWDVYKIGEDDDILWHCGESSWGEYKWMNSYSIGIEVIGPLKNGFTFEQRSTVKTLVRTIMDKYNIPKQNVLRHAHIAPKRKVDIDLRFLNDSEGNKKYISWEHWQNSL